jgi:glutathionyl-hydroquinone reductase
MINSVRNTILAILNKNNYGYISPADFNLFAKQAQLDIFDDYFYQYNQLINKENARLSGTGYADIRKGYEEVIDMFSETKTLNQNLLNQYFLPSQTTTGDDYYLINKVLCSSGGVYQGEAEKVSNSKITMLNLSNLTAPTFQYPAYNLEGSFITIYPAQFNGATDVQAQYIRYPKTPNWTYLTVANGDPAFNQSNADFQDFELSPDDETSLVFKILQYAGISIRDIQEAQFGAEQEQMEEQKEN